MILRLLNVTCLTLVLATGIGALGAQEPSQTGRMEHEKPSVPSAQLTIRGLDGESVKLAAADLASLPHKTVPVYNAHTKTNESYAGVSLIDVLKKVGVPSGENVRGKVLMTAVVAEGTDHYQVLYALAEIDPSIHTGEVIVADAMDGRPLDKDGSFKLVSSEERRPARWVRNLTRISVIAVQP